MTVLLCVILQLCFGTVYAWSFFQTLLVRQLGWAFTETAIAFSITIFSLGMSAAWVGAALPRLGPRKLAIMGSLMFSCGYLLAGLADPSIDPEVLAQYGATLIAVSSLCNGVGRLFWGLLSDRIGRVRVFRFLLASQMVVFGILMTESNPWIFSALVCYVLLCFGGGGHLRSGLCRLYQGSVP